ncbi:hypothetical protein LCGC14_0492100 [marine sediment metagenome]|uniref:Methyl-accepting chemotaxis protein n=1 Tax=marine sediment metagenome TaxID=412755 RepID=A0A0F9S6B9_9ZZZZ|nr:MAG: Methyl-accepting chemotaxis protein McpC [Candidatus Lokiarchaeum sp. GC14_75]HEA71209.1 methyl-accepting chemotaxis protein [archaeon]
MNLKKTGANKVTKTTGKRRLKFGIKQKLIIYFLLIAIIPIVGITIYSTISLNQSYEADRLDQLHATGMSKADYIEEWLFERKGDNNLLSRSHTLTSYAAIAGDPSHPNKTEAIAMITHEMDNMVEVSGTYNEMYLLNTSGIIVAQTSKTGWTYGHTVGADQSTKEYFLAALLQSTNMDFTYLSDFRLSSSGDYIQITTASLVHDSETMAFVGLLVFYIDTMTIHGIMHETEGLGTSGETYLINQDLLWLTTSRFDYYTIETGKYSTIMDTILSESISTAGIVESMEAKKNIMKSSNTGYRGMAVMGVYHYRVITDDGRAWIIVAEINVAEALAVPNNLMTVSVWIVVIISIIVAVLGYIIAKKFTDPIIRLNAEAIKVADGDLTMTGGNGKVRKGNDEIAVLTRSFGIMTTNIRDIILSSQQASINVANIATELAASSNEVNAASEEISSTTQEVSQNTQSQVNSLVDINKMANEIQALSHEVMASTKDINKIMDLITGISDQTNLLALNASIEAGRAGEHGRGFAVVADEVRKLAEESQNAVRETGDKMESITARITNTVRLIGSITADIESVTAAGQENSRAMEGISASSEQQTASMEEVTTTANKLGTLADDLKASLEIFRLQEKEVFNQVNTVSNAKAVKN